MKKYLQIFFCLLICLTLLLSCACKGNTNTDKDKDKTPSSSEQDITDSSDDGFSEDDGLGGNYSDNSSDKNDKDSSSKKEFDKYNPVGYSSHLTPTVEVKVENDKENNAEEKDDEEEKEDGVFTDSVKYPNSVNAEALNKTDLFNTYDATLFSEKIWEGKTVYYETICFEEDKNGFISTANLLYEPDQIIALRSADMTVTYTEGKDYTVNGRVVTRTRGSNAPYLDYQDSGFFVPWVPGASRTYQLAADPTRALYWNKDGKVLQRCIVTVFYTHKDGWRGNTMPESQEEELPDALDKLKNGKDFKIVFYGDSLTAGYTASGNTEDRRNLSGNFVKHNPANTYPPYVSAYPSMVTEVLKKKFPDAKITKVNAAAPSAQTGDQYGTTYVNLVTQENPDVAVIAFGGNDHGRITTIYKNNISKIVEKIHEANPKCEFILVPYMLPNMDVLTYVKSESTGQFDAMERILYEIQKEYSDYHIAVVPTTSLWRDFYALGKKPSDYLAALDNHPNDWGQSIYAQLVLNAFGV